MKGAVKPDHIAQNNYILLVAGAPPITFVKVGGIEEQITRVTLPDFTSASGGRKPPIEFPVEVPIHHTVENAYMETWFKMGQDPVIPGYKKTGTLLLRSISGLKIQSFQYVNLWVFKRKTSDLDMHDDGNLVVSQWMMSADDIIP